MVIGLVSPLIVPGLPQTKTQFASDLSGFRRQLDGYHPVSKSSAISGWQQYGLAVSLPKPAANREDRTGDCPRTAGQAPAPRFEIVDGADTGPNLS